MYRASSWLTRRGILSASVIVGNDGFFLVATIGSIQSSSAGDAKDDKSSAIRAMIPN